jgi:hypothetical protein
LIGQITDLEVHYAPDYRQQIAESWPRTIQDQFARDHWGWAPQFDLEKSINHMTP